MQMKTFSVSFDEHALKTKDKGNLADVIIRLRSMCEKGSIKFDESPVPEGASSYLQAYEAPPKPSCQDVFGLVSVWREEGEVYGIDRSGQIWFRDIGAVHGAPTWVKDEAFQVPKKVW